MAFVVETGDGLADANSYLAVVDFTTYCTDRGYNLGTADNTAKQHALVQATDYINFRYANRWKGFRQVSTADTQAMDWPRQDGVYADGRNIAAMPTELLNATAEYAFRALNGPLVPDPTYSDSNALVKEHEEHVGPIYERTLFGQEGVIYTFRSYPIADNLLKPLLIGGGSFYLLRG